MDRPSWPSNLASKCVSVPFFIGSVVVTAVTTGTFVHHWYHRRSISSSKSEDDDGGDDDGTNPSATLTARIRPPLRHTTPIEGEGSRIVYLTGIDKQTTQDELIDLFSCQMTILPIEMDLSEVSFAKTGGRAWALYRTSQDARWVQSTLHQKPFHGCILCCRLELGVTKEGQRIVDRSSHTAIVRGIQTRRGTPTTQQQRRKKNKKTKIAKNMPNNAPMNSDESSSYDPTGPLVCKEITPKNNTGYDHLPVTYSHRSISVGTIEYPFPSGSYLTKLIQRLSSFRRKIDNQLDRDQRRHRPPNDDNDDYDDDDIASSRYGSDADDGGRMLDLLTDVTKLGNGSIHKYTKEISEAMAMADALQRAIKIVYGVPPDDLSSSMSFDSIRCYCLGDGTYPVSAASIATFLWTSDGDRNRDNSGSSGSGSSKSDRDNVNFKIWKFISIDPLLKIDEFSNGLSDSSRCAGGEKRNLSTFDRIECFRGYSQEYPISLERDPNVLSIAIACHSHAPLEEFWGRMPSPKLCVSMPCCAQYSEIPDETPVLTYDDFEVYSPKRTIKIFASAG